MKSLARPRTAAMRLSLAALLTLASFVTSAGEDGSIRLAIGPFFAPPTQESLRQASAWIPELLTADLSHSTDLVLVEREKVQAVCRELQLSSASLVDKATVANLGQLLACDWIVSGSLVEATGRTHLWTKIIDVRAGIVLNLHASPYQPNAATNLASQIARFITETRTRTRQASAAKPTLFLTLGRFVDMTPPSVGAKRGDWSGRLASVIEKHAFEAGYGIAEMAAVGPIFEERRLGADGLRREPEQRVALQPAFWLIDGACEWLVGDVPRLAIGLRVQQVSGPEQIFRFTNAPNDTLEKELLTLLSQALSNTNGAAPATPNPEADVLAARGREMAERRSPFTSRQTQSSGSTPWSSYKALLEQDKKRPEHRRAITANYQRLLLRDPENQEAKTMLAYCWIAEGNPENQERGVQALREVASNKKDPAWAEKAERFLSNTRVLEQTIQESRRGPQRPKDWNSLNQAYAEDPEDPEIKCDLAAALATLPRSEDRQRGKKLLQEVALSGNMDQAERARRLLAEMSKASSPPPSP